MQVGGGFGKHFGLIPTLFIIVNVIRIDDEQSTGLIRGVSLGTLAPGSSAQAALSLISAGGAGDRILDISVRSRPPSSDNEGDESNADEVALETSEVLRTLVVPTLDPFTIVQDVKYRRSLASTAAPTDLRTFNESWWDDGDGGEAHVRTTFECVGPWGLKVEGVKLLRHASCIYCGEIISLTVFGAGCQAREGDRRLCGQV